MPPLGPAEVTAAFAAGAVTRGLVVGAVTTAAMSVAVGFDMPSPLLALYFAVTGALFFGLLGVAAGIWAEKFDHLSAVTNFAVTPLTFLRSEEHTSELQSLMRISYAVFCLKKKKTNPANKSEHP